MIVPCTYLLRAAPAALLWPSGVRDRAGSAANPALTTGHARADGGGGPRRRGDGDGELDVQPLRDSQVDDLRHRAARLEQQGHHRDAAAALDQAIALVADDPALMQERAEVALLLGDQALAGELAARALGLGPGVGPLCRRHHATLEQVALLQGDADRAKAARAAIEGCRVAPPPRW